MCTIFPSPQNDNNVVLVMDVHGLIPAGQGDRNVSFDPGVLYQIKIDTTRPETTWRIWSSRPSASVRGADQQVGIAGPMKPLTTGTTAIFGRRNPVLGTINGYFPAHPNGQPNLTVFAGVRADPFFFDVEQFYTIFPDRITPLTGKVENYPNPNNPQAGWLPACRTGPGFSRRFRRALGCGRAASIQPRRRSDPGSGRRPAFL